MMVFCKNCRKPYASSKDYNEYVEEGVSTDFICPDCTSRMENYKVLKEFTNEPGNGDYILLYQESTGLKIRVYACGVIEGPYQ